jgi:hypothetical protein
MGSKPVAPTNPNSGPTTMGPTTDSTNPSLGPSPNPSLGPSPNPSQSRDRSRSPSSRIHGRGSQTLGLGSQSHCQMDAQICRPR